MVNRGSNNLSLLLGNGAGSFGAAINFGVDSNPQSLSVGDLDGDGDLDLAVANRGSNTVTVLRNLACP